MIVFNNWQISVAGLIARQYDNLSRRIDVEGDLPAGYTWQLLVQSGGNADTILLEATEKGAGALLTADNLSKAGEYYIQLRGVLEADGVTRRHTNVVSAYIPESLTGLGTWPEVPTEFSQVEARILELYQHPPIPGSNGYWLVWDTDKDEYVESQLALPEAAAGGTSDHSKLKNRDAANQHPMSAITGLQAALEGKQAAGNYLTDKDLDATLAVEGKAADAKAVGDQLSALSEEMLTEESDPTVPAWAKAAQKPSYTASEVGADPSGTAASQVSTHNTGTDTHSDIRLLIQGLSERLSAVADSDDATLDQLSEVVAYIKSNRDLISAITTSKVNVADIVDNLTTNVANKPLSAAQGVALKALIDAITIPEVLPNPNALTFTGAVTGSYDGSAPLEVNIPNGGSDKELTLLEDINFDGNTASIFEYTGLDDVSEIYIVGGEIKSGLDNATAKFSLYINDIIIAASSVMTIQKASGTDKWNEYNILRFNGAFWESLRSPNHGGASATGHTNPAKYPNAVVLDVGKAKKVKLVVPNPAYKPVTGWMKIWVR